VERRSKGRHRPRHHQVQVHARRCLEAHGLTGADVESRIDKFDEGGEEGLRASARELEANFEAERKDLRAKVGELTFQGDAFKKQGRGPRLP
jgi:hypothetical protein